MAEAMRSMPTAKIAIELAMISQLPTLHATAMPMIEPLMAPAVSEAIGANSDLISAARISGGSSASARSVWIIRLISMCFTRLPLHPRKYRPIFNTRQIDQAIATRDEPVSYTHLRAHE